MVPSSYAASGHAPAGPHNASGLTDQGIEGVQSANLPSQLVKMAPQSTLKVLDRATKLGPHAANAEIELTIGLKLHNVAKLKSFLEQVQNPASPVYHQWLTPQNFTQLYGPTKADVARVARFLKAQGIRIQDVAANRMLIHTEATTEAYEHAFGIRINDYKLAGRRFYSTQNRPVLPRAVAPLVTSILGLNHGVKLHPHHYVMPAGAMPEGLSPREAPPPNLLTYNPLQIATAYNVPDITDASGAQGSEIAIVTALSPNVATNDRYSQFWSAFGLPDHTINVIEVGGSPGTGGETETTLDIQYAGAMGPGAMLNVYVCGNASTATFIDAYNQMVVDNISAVMSTSWGLYDSGWGADAIATSEQIFMQAAAQGITMFAAAGDNGASDNGGGLNNADYPSSSAYVTASNGTDLTLSDVSGTYGSEVVWNDSDGCGLATGGAISRFIDKPAWQTGPGVPTDIDMRMNSDVALTASCSHSMYIFLSYAWVGVAGTSAVAPQLAGIFAQIVSFNFNQRLGIAGPLIYGDVNDGYYATDFHDVTEGCNGKLPDGSGSCAKTGWDHPTGWGSLNVENLMAHLGVLGPRGTLTGTVTAAATGSAIAGAKIVITATDGSQYKVQTADDGSYSQVVPPGDATVDVSHFGYTEVTTSVSIVDGQTTTKGFELATAPMATLSGKVTDGSGHGYGLYAEIKVSTEAFGQVATAWTNPATGAYSVELPQGDTYDLNAAAAFSGYDTASKTVMLSGDKTQDLSLVVAATCTAPGYSSGQGGNGFSQGFSGMWPPAGWTVTRSGQASSVGWTSSQNAGVTDNRTGGTGAAAVISANATKTGRPYGSELVSPAIAVASLKGATVLTYQANYQPLHGGDELALGISTDGGASWTTIKRWTKAHGKLMGDVGETVRVNLASYLPASGKFQLRWRYENATGDSGFYAQIDAIHLGAAACTPIPGGLVTGRVTDAKNGEALIGATVTDDLGNSAKTLSNPADPNLPEGTYLTFSGQGDRTLTANYGHYTVVTKAVTVPANKIVSAVDFSLPAPDFRAKPDAITVNVMAKSTATASFALSNVGSGAGAFTVYPINAPPPPTGSAAIPVRHVRIKHPEWINKSMLGFRGHAQSSGWTPIRSRGRDSANHGVSSNAGAWVNETDYPDKVGDSLAAWDSQTDKLYVISGVTRGGPALQYASYVYDPEAGTWSPIAQIPVARGAPVGGFIDGKLYVVNGSGSNGLIAELDIYDPATDSWSTGAPIPEANFQSAAAVLNGKLYVVGGQNGQGLHATVFVYDPVKDKWSTAADYPYTVSMEACGAIVDKLYCAGGLTAEGGSGRILSEGYVYDPPTDAWSPIADMPLPNGVAGSLYAAASGKLLLSGGFVGLEEATNQVIAYDPNTDSWLHLPNTNTPVARGGGSCSSQGFYNVGSILGILKAGLYVFSDAVQRLPSYTCGGEGIPWLTVAPVHATVSKGASAQVMLTFDGSEQSKYTTSQGYLKIAGSPYKGLIVPVTVNWLAQPVDLDVSGSVSPIGKVEKGQTLTYDIAVQNLKDAGGTATRTTLTYKVPQGLSYVGADGATCAQAGASSGTNAAVSASVAGPASVVCKLGTIAPDKGKGVTLYASATAAAESVSSAFTASARESQEGSGATTLTLTTNQAEGPPGPTGPKGPKGDEGSGGFGLAGLVFIAMLALMARMAKIRMNGTSSQGGQLRVKRMFAKLPVVAGLLVAACALALPGSAWAGTASAPDTSKAAHFKPAGQTLTVSGVLDRARTGQPPSENALRWVEQRVVADDGKKGDEFGRSVAVSGNTAVVGALRANAAYVFTKSNGRWEQTAKLTSNKGGQFGQSVALSKDGNTALVGAPTTTVDGVFFRGAVYVFTKSDGTWAQTAMLSAGGMLSVFGFSVALSGQRAVVGAVYQNVNGKKAQGAAYVFKKSNGSWTQEAMLVASDGKSNSGFGISVAMSGTTVFVGAIGASIGGGTGFPGAAYVFEKSSDGWEQTQKLAARDDTPNAEFGDSVALSGNRALIGAPYAAVDGHENRGAAYVFTHSSGSWVQTAKLVAPDGLGDDRFGRAVALSGRTALIGSYFADVDNHKNQGAAYLFNYANGSWVQRRKLTASDGAAEHHFGWSVALDGDTALIGNGYHDPFKPKVRTGAAYFYAQAHLGLAVSAPAKVTAGHAYLSQTIVTNKASSASPAVVAMIPVPAAASFISGSTAQGSCDQSQGQVICDLGSVPGNAGVAKATVKLKAPLNENAPTALQNSASLKVSPPLTASSATQIDLLPVDLLVDGSLRPAGEVHKGDNRTYTITVTNLPRAKGAATGTQLIYEIPEGVSYLASDWAGCAPPAGTASGVSHAVANSAQMRPAAVEGPATVACNLGLLKPDQAKAVKIFVQATSAASSISATFKAQARAEDSNPANNVLTLDTRPASGPPGPTGPQGPKGDEGSGGLAFGGLALLALLALSAGAVESRRRRGGTRHD